MKTKSSARCILPSVIILAVAAALSHADPPPAAPPSEAEDRAKAQVAIEFHAKLSPPRMSFSRAAPVPTHQLEFQPRMLVEGEARLPFKISLRRDPKATAVQGYVRITDRAIFLLDPRTGKYRPSTEDPRFGPLQKIEPVKPL